MSFKSAFMGNYTCVAAAYKKVRVLRFTSYGSWYVNGGGHGSSLVGDRILLCLVGQAHILPYQKVAGLAHLVLHIVMAK